MFTHISDSDSECDYEYEYDYEYDYVEHTLNVTLSIR